MITFSLTDAWKGLNAIIQVGTRLFTTDTLAVHANAWAKELATKNEEKLAAVDQWSVFWKTIKSKKSKEESKDDLTDAATTVTAAAAQEAENAEIRENIALELARKKMGLREETGLDGKPDYWRQSKNGKWNRIREK